jgi:hypothetical protein
LRIATIAILVSSLAATAAFAQDPPDPASPPAEAPAASAPPAADAQQPAADAQADRAAEGCRQRSTESRLRSARRQRCPVALRPVATAREPNVVAPEEDEPAQSPTIPPASRQPH